MNLSQEMSNMQGANFKSNIINLGALRPILQKDSDQLENSKSIAGSNKFSAVVNSETKLDLNDDSINLLDLHNMSKR